MSVVPRSRSGQRKDPEDGTIQAISFMGRRKQPPDVTGLQAAIVDNAVLLRWDCSTKPEVKGYQIRQGNRWLGALMVIDCTAENVVTLPVDWIGSRTFLVKAISRSGIMSDQAVSVTATNASSNHIVLVTSTQDPGFAGTKTNASVSGGFLEVSVGSGLTGTYQTGAIALGSLGDFRLFVTATTDIKDVALSADLACIAADSPWAKRKLADDTGSAGWEGTENNDLLGAEGFLFPADPDSLYAGCGGVDRPYDFQNCLTLTVEYRISTSGGAVWGAWQKYRPVVENMDTVDVRVTLTTPHKKLIPRLKTLAIHVATPATDTWVNVGGGFADPNSHFTETTLSTILREIGYVQKRSTLAWLQDMSIASGSWWGATVAYQATPDQFAAQCADGSQQTIGLLQTQIPTWYQASGGTQYTLRVIWFVAAAPGATQAWVLRIRHRTWDAGDPNFGTYTNTDTTISVPNTITANAPQATTINVTSGAFGAGDEFAGFALFRMGAAAADTFTATVYVVAAIISSGVKSS